MTLIPITPILIAASGRARMDPMLNKVVFSGVTLCSRQPFESNWHEYWALGGAESDERDPRQQRYF
jgi:hypothetical protein